MLKNSLLAFLSLACLKLCFAAPQAEKRCVFSIEVIRDGGGMADFGYTGVGDGIFLYEHADGQITGERYQRLEPYGTIRRMPEREVFGGGPEFTRRVRELFKKAAIKEVDFHAAVEAAKGALPPGKSYVQTGAKAVSVFADLEGTRFRFSYTGVGWHLKVYAEYDTKLGELKSLLDGVAYEYGRARIFID